MMIVSKATLREEDLCPSFLDSLKELSEPEYLKVKDTLEGWGHSIEDVYDEDSEFYDSEDPIYLLEILYDRLNDVAPPGTWFGAHVGDGALFGFWEPYGWGD